jgi:hypothetical protein
MRAATRASTMTERKIRIMARRWPGGNPDDAADRKAVCVAAEFHRLVVRYERYAENFLGKLYFGCCLILLRLI